MLKLTLFEYLTRALPEAFILVLAMIVLCDVRIDRKKYCFSGFLLSAFEYLVRELPINYGVHTILNIFIMILIINKLYKVDILMSIKSSMICTIVLFICEALNMIFLNVIFADNIKDLISDDITKILCGIPSLTIFLAIIWIIYIMKKRKKNESN